MSECEDFVVAVTHGAIAAYSFRLISARIKPRSTEANRPANREARKR
ncbi:MAG: hypothetical protein MI861_17185 [Pirellulales bacterium]|nr:hypothetical protein [Pirellulales bacterium]